MRDKTRQTPYDIYEAILGVLGPKRIEKIRRDQELIRDGWQIHFAIDPHDIREFCFPFSPSSLVAQFKTSIIEKASRQQNGRYEAIYRLSTKPILLEPYIEEVEDIRDWAKWSRYVPTESELLDKYLSYLRIPSEQRPDEIKNALKEITNKDISSLIAIVTGIVSIGIGRLEDVLTNRLVRGMPDITQGSAGPKLVSRDKVVREACDVFEVYYRQERKRQNRQDDKRLPSKWRQRSEEIIDRNNKRDAQAMDQLLQLNEFYNPQGHIILFLSSSPKSRSLFKRDVLKPIINGSPYDLVRTARDLFVYMVYRGDSDDPIEKARVAVAKLTELEELFNNVERIRNKFEAVSLQCEHCNKDNQLPRCEFGTHCEGVVRMGEYIAKRQEANITLSLQKRLAQTLENARKDTKWTQKSDKYSGILETIADILKGKPKFKAINEEMEANLQSSLTKAHFVSAFVTSSPTEESIRVSNYLNYHPVRLRVNDKDLKAIVDSVIRILPKGKWSIDKFHEYVGQYLNLDSAWDINVESELVRCFLYLIIGEEGQAASIIEKFLSSEQASWREIFAASDRKFPREFMYLQCFTLWHAKQFQRALDVADEGIKRYRSDGRFYHCRSIIISDVLRSPDAAGVALPPSGWADVVENARIAIKHYSSEMDTDMIAVNFNNLAYFYSSDIHAGLNLDEAERNLRELTKRIPEKDWALYPEFYHTKGTVLHAKFLATEDAALLVEAYKAAEKAIEIYPEKAEHGALRKTIKESSEKFAIPLPEPPAGG